MARDRDGRYGAHGVGRQMSAWIEARIERI